MEFRAGTGAVWILRIVTAIAGLVLSGLLYLLLCWLPWTIRWLTGVPLLVAASVCIWVLPRFTRSIRGNVTATAVRAYYGIFWQRELFVPLHSLRNFEVWAPPLHRVFACRTVVLRFAGGSVLLPLLAHADAVTLTDHLEQVEEVS